MRGFQGSGLWGCVAFDVYHQNMKLLRFRVKGLNVYHYNIKLLKSGHPRSVEVFFGFDRYLYMVQTYRPLSSSFYGLYLESYKVIPKRNYLGAYG